ncbi:MULTISPECIES: hypothetical protein [unclassified Bradyrhizobium]|uniref:hypothetical protein n=1 Tax=unclassified Bradyrhizobium TaxID=2631580 RepID=UPI001FFB0019|nr:MULTISPECIES: hypothetical protein [unclassified Bradyrhizobium]MCK1707715.1 hypothetical protein [Bradyrhizobium sp. 143]MCK1730016.1 hypothetical protein [Bradyrhizobium sp. 142]UPJ68594.1 hypothetical protein IVB23_15845 [Bradyrhizobium sp. 191]
MSRSFVTAFALSLVSVGLLLCGAGAGLAYLLVPEAPRRYATAIFSFAVPPGWTCRREQLDYICDSGHPPFASIVIFTMKHRGTHDTLDAYEDHLRGPIPAVGNKSGEAELVSLKRVRIAGTDWVEGIRKNSEVPNYETTYLAGITAEAAVLFTFSIHEPADPKRRRQLRSMADSLVIYQRR